MTTDGGSMHDDEENYSDPKQAIEYVKNGIERIAADFEEPDDDFAPILFLVSPCPDHDGEPHQMTIVPVHEMMGSDNSKKVLHNLVMPMLVKTSGAVAFAFVTSAWMVNISAEGIDMDEIMNSADPLADAQEALGGLAPSNHPNRYEAVFVIASNGSSVHGSSAKILRADGQIPTLDEWVDMGDAAKLFAGSFEAVVEAVRDNTNRVDASAN